MKEQCQILTIQEVNQFRGKLSETQCATVMRTLQWNVVWDQ